MKKILEVIQYILGVFLAFLAVSALSTGSIFTFIFLMVDVALLMPFSRKFLEDNFIQRMIHPVILIVLLVIFFLTGMYHYAPVKSDGDIIPSPTEAVEQPTKAVATPTARIATPTPVPIDKELLFRDIPWGLSYNEIEEEYLGEYRFMPLHGDFIKTMCVDQVLMGDNYSKNFEYSDINLICSLSVGEIGVAGYKADSVHMYYAFLPIDGYLEYELADTSLYGASYTIKPINLADVSADLLEKLTSLYGDPQYITKDTDLDKVLYTNYCWVGLNGTELVLQTRNTSSCTDDDEQDEIEIAYAWRHGDTLLQNASDAIKRRITEEEKDTIDSDNVDGL